MTPEDIEAEYWAHYFDGKAGGSTEEFTDEDFDTAAIVAQYEAEGEAEEAAAAKQSKAPTPAPVAPAETSLDPSEVDDWEEV